MRDPARRSRLRPPSSGSSGRSPSVWSTPAGTIVALPEDTTTQFDDVPGVRGRLPRPGVPWTRGPRPRACRSAADLSRHPDHRARLRITWLRHRGRCRPAARCRLSCSRSTPETPCPKPSPCSTTKPTAASRSRLHNARQRAHRCRVPRRSTARHNTGILLTGFIGPCSVDTHTDPRPTRASCSGLDHDGEHRSIVLDAMAGVTVVASEDRDVPVLCNPAVAQLVSGDPTEWAGAVESLLASEMNRQEPAGEFTSTSPRTIARASTSRACSTRTSGCSARTLSCSPKTHERTSPFNAADLRKKQAEQGQTDRGCARSRPLPRSSTAIRAGTPASSACWARSADSATAPTGTLI